LIAENEFYLTKEVCVGIKQGYNLKFKPDQVGA